MHPELEASPVLRRLHRASFPAALALMVLAFWLRDEWFRGLRGFFVSLLGPGLGADAATLAAGYGACLVGLQLLLFSGYFFVRALRGSGR